jgi:hypothetical protein
LTGVFALTLTHHAPGALQGSAAPMFADPNGTELWVLVLEKAFAKFVGTYGELDGGHPLWALEALTGDEVFKFTRVGEEQAWQKLALGHR